MKNLLFILLFFCGVVQAQDSIQYTPMSAAGYRYKYLLADSGFNVPYGDTAIKRGSTRPGALMCFSGDNLIYRWDGLQWIQMDGSTSNVSNCTTTKFNGDIIWTSGFNFANTLINYRILCRTFSTPAGNFSISTSDTIDRYTIVWADTLGNLGTTDGTALDSIAPIPSVDPNSQILLATYFIPAYSTQPLTENQDTLVNESIYKENVEWTGSSTLGANFANAVNPFEGNYSTAVSSGSVGQYIDWTDGASHLISDYSYLSFYIRLAPGGAFATRPIFDVSFYNNSSSINPTPARVANGAFGYNINISSSYQLVVIPISALTFTGSTFNKLRIRMARNSAVNYQIDNVILQSGGANISTTGVITFNGQSGNVTYNRTSLYNSDSSYMVNYVNGVRSDSIRLIRDTLTAGTNTTIVTTGRNHVINSGRFGVEDNVATSDRHFDMNGHSVEFVDTTPENDNKYFLINSTKPTALYWQSANYLNYAGLDLYRNVSPLYPLLPELILGRANPYNLNTNYRHFSALKMTDAKSYFWDTYENDTTNRHLFYYYIPKPSTADIILTGNNSTTHTLATSTKVNGTTYDADSTGLIDLGTISGGGSDTTLYKGDSYLRGSRTVELNGNNLAFTNVGGTTFSISPNDDRITLSTLIGSSIRVSNDDDDVRINYKDASTQIQLGAGSSKINHTADSSIFNGKVKIIDGTQQNGYVFTSDANGAGSWAAPTGGGGSGISQVVADYGLANVNDSTIKADTTILVNKAGNQTITGAKVFTQDLLVNGATVGLGAGSSITNISLGDRALISNTTGAGNSAVGRITLFANIDGNFNSAFGYGVMVNNTSGSSNSALGMSSLANNNGSYNNAMGRDALINNTNGSNNVSIGFESGKFLNNNSSANTAPNGNIYIGNNTTSLTNNDSNNIVISAGAYPGTSSGTNTTTIGNPRTILTWLRGAIDYDSLQKRRMVILGDSYSALDSTWPYQLRDSSAFFANSRIANYAVGGRTVAQILAAYNSEAHAIRPINTGDDYWLFTYCGQNSISSSVGVDSIFNNLKSIWALSRTDGFKTVAFSIINISTYTAPMQIVRQQLNDSIYAHRELYDYFVDVSTVLNQDSTPLLFSSTHLNQAGYRLMGGVVAKSLESKVYSISSASANGEFMQKFNTRLNGSIGLHTVTNSQMNAILNPKAGDMVANSDSSNRIFSYTGSAWKGYSFTDEVLKNASNGVKTVGDTVKLGGSLTENTTITAGSYGLTIDGTGSGNTLYGTATSGIGIAGYSASSYGISATSDNNIAGVFRTGNSSYYGSSSVNSSSVSTGIKRVMKLSSSYGFGAVSNGFGGSVDMYATTTTTQERVNGTINFIWSDATDASRTSELTITGVNNAVATGNLLTLAGNGVGSFYKGSNVASATTITATGNLFHVTGTTNITSVSGTSITAGAVITIIFDGVLTFTDGSNLKLNGDFVTTADDTITLSYDGTNFYEITRSVN